MRNKLLLSALNVSLESADLTENQEINPVTEETIVAVDEVLEEVRGGADDIEEHDEAVEELSEAAESLESLVSSLESFIADGGMSPAAADMHSRALAIATRRLPVNAADYTVSTESFGGTGDKLVASQEALEGVKKLLSNIWDAIRNAVRSAWNAVKEFFATIGKSGPAVIAAGQSLKKRAQASKGLKPGGDGKMRLTSAAANTLVIDGKMAPAEALSAIVHGYEVGVKQYTTKMVANLSPLMQAVYKGEVHPDRLKEAAAKIDLKAALPDDMKGKLPGGYYFDMTLPDSYVNGGTDLEVLSKASLKLSQDKSKVTKEGDVEVLTVEQIEKMADQIISIGKAMATAKSVQGAAEKGINDVVKAGDKLVASGDSLEKDEVASAKAVLAKLNKAARLTTGCSHQYLSFMGTAAKTAAAVGTHALKVYSKAAKKDAKEAAAE
jgi:hypothetical protein